MDSKARAVKGLFGDISRIYDRMNSVMSLGMDRGWRRELVRRAAIAPGGRVLDICSGTGEVALEAARAVGPRGTVMAVDFCPGMLEKALAKVEALGLSDVVSIQAGDALALPFPDSSFDSVTVAFGVRNLADIPQGFREMRRVLVSGGHVACLDLSRPSFPGFRQAYAIYFGTLVPLVGRIASGRRGPYDYLPESLRTFPVRQALAQIMADAGFADVTYTELALGTVAIHSGVKV